MLAPWRAIQPLAKPLNHGGSVAPPTIASRPRCVATEDTDRADTTARAVCHVLADLVRSQLPGNDTAPSALVAGTRSAHKGRREGASAALLVARAYLAEQRISLIKWREIR